MGRTVKNFTCYIFCDCSAGSMTKTKYKDIVTNGTTSSGLRRILHVSPRMGGGAGCSSLHTTIPTLRVLICQTTSRGETGQRAHLTLTFTRPSRFTASMSMSRFLYHALAFSKPKSPPIWSMTWSPRVCCPSSCSKDPGVHFITGVEYTKLYLGYYAAFRNSTKFAS